MMIQDDRLMIQDDRLSAQDDRLMIQAGGLSDKSLYNVGSK